MPWGVGRAGGGDYCRTEREWPGGGGAWLDGRAGSGRCLAIYMRASSQALARLPRAAPWDFKYR